MFVVMLLNKHIGFYIFVQISGQIKELLFKKSFLIDEIQKIDTDYGHGRWSMVHSMSGMVQTWLRLIVAEYSYEVRTDGVKVESRKKHKYSQVQI